MCRGANPTIPPRWDLSSSTLDPTEAVTRYEWLSDACCCSLVGTVEADSGRVLMVTSEDDDSVCNGEESESAEAPMDPAEDQKDSLDSSRMARRELMRKAAIGASVTGAVWAAPSIDGLSLVPDYAAAATGTGAFTFTVRTTDAENNYYVPTDSAGDVTPPAWVAMAPIGTFEARTIPGTRVSTPA